MSTELLWTGPEGGPVLVLAPGAGAAMDSAWMNRFCELLAERGIRTARFEFAYMAARRTGTRKPAPRADLVLDEYRSAVEAVVSLAGAPVAIGGKSFGGRVASMVADELHAAGSVSALVCLGYPFHPPGRPERLRTEHLSALRVPTLICQGTRDPFGTRAEVSSYALSPAIRIHWLEDGEHEFKPRVKISGHTHEQHLATAVDAVAAFVVSYDGGGESQGDVA
ncbi:dienelactone hydrolase [Herbiconiux sp. CPCC 205763]|uniref:Dienelactone hydrolase n=1 Tax=Herbiconiux aconitum TaxID=2970913 RepID=A0ABT2GN09_9MICO|nr:alpha/beta family hydrolase [Herbiconiux aconitum]MCS5717613.1 dienelactone hydrolase [Herbiconiux aconitum]